VPDGINAADHAAGLALAGQARRLRWTAERRLPRTTARRHGDHRV